MWGCYSSYKERAALKFNILEGLSFTYTANGTTSDSSWEILEIKNEQIKTAQYNSYG